MPPGCRVFTDGSLLDGRMQSGCQALGWAFVIIGPDGEMFAAAFGVPPEWVDTIQGAELWAVQMALLHAPFPDRLYTDCDSVRSGVSRSVEWTHSSKRKYARIWIVVSSQLDDADGDLV